MISAVPAEIPVITPVVALIPATVVLPLVHTPPAEALESVDVELAQTVRLPETVIGIFRTLTEVVLIHPGLTT